MGVLHRITWLCLLLAWIGAAWFSYQCFLVPQHVRFSPNWHDARWIQAVDGEAPVAYFRHVTTLNTLPDAAFVLVAANQTFKLYVNGTLVGSNATDFVRGNFPVAYLYDVAALLKSGPNVLALRVANLDKQLPALRANFGMVYGTTTIYQGSNESWQATARSSVVYPRYNRKQTAWTLATFKATLWPSAGKYEAQLPSPLLQINPQLYQRPLSTRWLSAGNGHEAYFIRRFSLPFASSGVWLRLAATGTASVFINGHLRMIWNGQAEVTKLDSADYLSHDDSVVQYRGGLAVGIYDISPDLHAGINTIAIRVVSPGVSAAQVGLESTGAALAVDILIRDWQQNSSWLNTQADWQAAPHFVERWMEGTTLQWSPPLLVGRPGAGHLFYLPDTPTERNIEIHPFAHAGYIILLSAIAVFGLWLVIALTLMRGYYQSPMRALEVTSLAYLPALAAEALLIALAREPQLPQPFPYTWSWGVLLLVLVAVGYLLLYLNAHKQASNVKQGGISRNAASRPSHEKLLQMYLASSQRVKAIIRRVARKKGIHSVLSELHTHHAIVFLVLLAMPLIAYSLSYEPYWQDELSSYYAARGVLAQGLPFFPSGFLYMKAELYSYLLAGWIHLFGDHGSNLRVISALEYIVSIPLLYAVGCYFFERRIALLAAAMLAFSPISLVWGRQVRMYEQAQLSTLLVVYLFYKALQEPKRVYLIYVAMLALVATYLSHEETFIMLPALLLCALLASWKGYLPTVLFHKHWWFAAFMGGSIIGTQYLLTHITHPPILGTDSSQRPFIQLTTSNIPYYIDLLFFPSTLGKGTLPWITINSVLATLGCLWSRRGSNPRARYCALFLLFSLLTLVFVFTMQADRYLYPLLPIYYLMGAYALFKMLHALWGFVRPRIILSQKTRWAVPVLGGYLSKGTHLLIVGTVSLLLFTILLAPILPLSRYNLFISRIIGFSYHRHYPDYDVAGRYLQQHRRPGDIVISVAPDFCTFYYAGKVDYFFSIDRALFLLERDGYIINTSLGTRALLNQEDLQAVLARYPRIWIISDNGPYQAQVAKRFTFPPDFRIVFEGYGSAIYLRGG
jgi:4-amino-4-deoxy-L-arabinose transferase-like glycosyltransferase